MIKTINPFPTNGVQRAQKEKGIPLVSCCFFHPLIQQDSNNSLSNNTGSWAINHPAIQAFKLVGFNLALTNPVPAEWLEFFIPLPTWSFAPRKFPTAEAGAAPWNAGGICPWDASAASPLQVQEE